jgi:hypothetical protein
MCDGRNPLSKPVITAYRQTTGKIDARTPFHGPPALRPPTYPAIICPNIGSHQSIRDSMSTYFDALQKLNATLLDLNLLPSWSCS